MDKKKISAVSMFALGVVLLSPIAAFAQCQDFNSFAASLEPNPWGMTVGGGFPAAQMQFTATGATYADLEVIPYPPAVNPMGPTYLNSLRVHGINSDAKILAVLGNGAYPTSFSLEILDQNADATVGAYDSSGTLLASKVALKGAVTSISFSGLGPIAYLYIFGNQNEMYVDNVCIG